MRSPSAFESRRGPLKWLAPMCSWTGVQHVIVEASAEPVMPTSVTALLDKIRALEAKKPESD